MVAALERVSQSGLPDVVDGRPLKVADDVGKPVYGVPYVGHRIGVGLRAVDDAVGIFGVVALVAAQLVVVTAHFHQLKSPGRVLLPRHLLGLTVPVVVHGEGGRSGGVLVLDGAGDGICDFLAARDVGALSDLVAYAPHDDGGVVAVAAHHQGGIILEVGDARSHGFSILDNQLLAGEIIAVVVASLGFLPLVETLVDDEQPDTVAGIKEGLGRQVVAGPHSIEPLCFKQFCLADFCPVDGGCSQQSVIVMDAASPEFGGLSVEQESPLGREVDGSHTKRDDQCVVLSCSSVEADSCGVAVR